LDADGHHRQKCQSVAQAGVAGGDVRRGVGNASHRVDRRVELGSLLDQGATGDEAACASGDVADRCRCHHAADRAGDATDKVRVFMTEDRADVRDVDPRAEGVQRVDE
jgi:hypothetical protein